MGQKSACKLYISYWDLNFCEANQFIHSQAVTRTRIDDDILDGKQSSAENLPRDICWNRQTEATCLHMQIYDLPVMNSYDLFGSLVSGG